MSSRPNPDHNPSGLCCAPPEDKIYTRPQSGLKRATRERSMDGQLSLSLRRGGQEDHPLTAALRTGILCFGLAFAVRARAEGSAAGQALHDDFDTGRFAPQWLPS